MPSVTFLSIEREGREGGDISGPVREEGAAMCRAEQSILPREEATDASASSGRDKGVSK